MFDALQKLLGGSRKPAPRGQTADNRITNQLVAQGQLPANQVENVPRYEDEANVRTRQGLRPLNSVNMGQWWQNPQTGYTPPHLSKRYEDGSGFNQFGRPLQAYDDSPQDYIRKLLGL